LRLGPQDPARMAELGVRIATTAATLLRPGGVLVYAVCSASREEGAGVAERLEAAGLSRLVDRVDGLALAPDPDGVFRIGPFERDGGPDAYQITRLRRP